MVNYVCVYNGVQHPNLNGLSMTAPSCVSFSNSTLPPPSSRWVHSRKEKYGAHYLDFSCTEIALNLKLRNLKLRMSAQPVYLYIYIYIYIQGVTGGTDQTSGGCSLC